MGTGIFITMGSIAVVCAVTEKVLGKLGKIEEAGMISTAGAGALGITVVGIILKVFGELKKLG